MSKKTIKLSSPEGNVFYIIGWVTENCIPDAAQRKAAFDKLIDIGEYDGILAAIKFAYGDRVEFVA